MKSLIGTGVALITPFNKDKSVDVEGLKKLVRFNIENGVDYFVVLGTTAETATLNAAEKQVVIDTIVAENNGQIPLVIGIGGNNTLQVIEQMKQMDLSPFSAILSVSPYYNKPSQEGIYQHFAAIAKEATLPILLYNVPGRTASNMAPQTVVRLANEFKNIIGIKEAAGNIAQAMELIRTAPKDFLVISGDDLITLPMILAGGAGVISVIGEGLPKDFSTMVRLGLERKVDEAYALHYKMTEIIELIFEEGNPVGIKELLQQQNICTNEVRLPLVNATPQLSEKIKHYLKENY